MPTKISWTDETWPITVGCTQVSPGCRFCYAMRSVHRVNLCQSGGGRPAPYGNLVELVQLGGRQVPRWTGEVGFFPERLAMPLAWRSPRRIFVASQSDVFHDKLTNEQIAAIFGVMAATPRHTYQVLTKRPARMVEWFRWIEQEAREDAAADGLRDGMAFALATYAADVLGDGSQGDQERHFDRLMSMFGMPADGPPWPLPNVWLGVSVEDQAAADERIPLLLQAPAAVRFLSCEPLLGPVDLTAHCPPFYAPHLRRDRIGWVIAGCESGHGARPCEVDWLRSLRDLCAATGVPYFLKQAVAGIGVHVGDGSRGKAGGVIELPYLDGKQWAQFPEVAR